MTKSIDQQKYQRLADWAENDPEFFDALRSAHVIEGTDATRHEAAEMIKAARGRPSLGEEQAKGRGRSPRRQVRLPEELNRKLDVFAAEHERTPSEVMREALESYLSAA